MSAPPPVVPVPPPIEPSPRSGCWRTGLIGCGALAIVGVLGIIALVMYVKRRPEVFTDFLMKQVEANYAADVTEEDKRGLRDAYAEFRTALVSRQIRPEDLERVQQTIELGGRDGITRSQVHELTEAFRRGARLPREGSEPDPAESLPAVSPTPSP